MVVLICFHLPMVAQTEKSYDSLIEVHFKRTPLHQAFAQMQTCSGITIGYLWEYLKYSKHVTLDTVARLSVIMDICLREQPLEWSWEMGPTPPMIAVTPKAIQGWVTDSSGKPVYDVNINGDTRNTSTNRKGYYFIPKAASDSILTFTSVNWDTVIIKLYGQTEVSVKMSLKIKNMDSVINDGYHFIPKERQTGSFSLFSKADLEQSTSTSVFERMIGKAQGVLFNYSRNTYTNEPKIQIRGQSSIYANSNALIILDGFPFRGDFRSINPNDILNVSILHDAAAASVWGAKAGNGVIVITSKKSKFSQPLKIKVNSSLTITPKKDLFYLPQLTPQEFFEFENLRFDSGYYEDNLNSYNTALSNNIEVLAAHRNGKITKDVMTARLSMLQNHDVRNDLKKYFYRTGILHQQYINISKGNNKFGYNFSGGYNNEMANEINSNNETITLNGGITYKFKGLEILTYNYVSWYKNVNAGRLPTTHYPNSFLVDSSGRSAVEPSDIRQFYKDSINTEGILPDWNLRPLDELKENKLLYKRNNQTFNINIKYTLLKKVIFNLYYQLHLNKDKLTDYNSAKSYKSRHIHNSFTQVENNVLSFAVPKGGILTWQENKTRNDNGRFQVSGDFGNPNTLRIFGLLGAEFGKTTLDTSAGIYYGYYPDLTQEAKVDYISQFPMFYDQSKHSQIPFHSGTASNFDYSASMFANVGFTYRGRYNLTGSIRTDESNLFGPGEKGKRIPLGSCGVKWDVKEEPWLKLSWLSYLNIRASIGTSGNINTFVSAYLTADRAPTNSAGQTPISIITPGNNYIRWERSSMRNIAVEWADVKHIIEFTFEYYWRDSRYLLAPSLQDPTYGFIKYWDNKAGLRGKGFDLSVHTNISNSDNFQFSNLFWLSLATTKVTSFENPATQARYFINNNFLSPKEGAAVYSIYAYRWAGLDPLTGDPRVFLGGNPSAEYNKINKSSPDSSLINIGSSIPTLYGAFNPSIRIKGFSAYLTIVGKFKYFFKRGSVNYSDPYTSLLAGENDFSGRWRKPGDEKNTNVPSLKIAQDNDRDNTYANSSVLVEKADNIKIKRIGINLDLNKVMRGYIGIKRCSLFIVIENIGTIWKASKTIADPDFLYSLKDSRSYTLGFTVDL
jgi:TonB-dependent starch-binding outer membrane protein SusC